MSKRFSGFDAAAAIMQCWKKRQKKGQSASEAAVIISVLTFFLILALAAIADDLVKASDNNYRALLQDMADVVEEEGRMALSSEDGYFHAFTLPPTLNGLPYTVNMTNSTSISGSATVTLLDVVSRRPGVTLDVTKVLAREIRGNLVRGQNTVRKEQGIVIFRPVPLTQQQKDACANSCGAMAEECCDHGYISCCQ